MASNSIFRRYSREILVKEIGIKGLRKLRSSKVTIVGCGALGSTEGHRSGLCRHGAAYRVGV